MKIRLALGLSLFVTCISSLCQGASQSYYWKIKDHLPQAVARTLRVTRDNTDELQHLEKEDPAQRNVQVLDLQLPSPALSSKQKSTIREWVASGGGIILYAGSRITNFDLLYPGVSTERFQPGVTGGSVTWSADPVPSEHPVVRNLENSVEIRQMTKDGFGWSTVAMPSLRFVIAESLPLTALLHKEGNVVAVAGNYQKGRVFVLSTNRNSVGSFELAVPWRCGSTSNTTFSVNLFRWLAGYPDQARLGKRPWQESLSGITKRLAEEIERLGQSLVSSELQELRTILRQLEELASAASLHESDNQDSTHAMVFVLRHSPATTRSDSEYVNEVLRATTGIAPGQTVHLDDCKRPPDLTYALVFVLEKYMNKLDPPRSPGDYNITHWPFADGNGGKGLVLRAELK